MLEVNLEDAGADLYQASRRQLDFTGKYDLNDQLQMFFNAVNISDNHTIRITVRRITTDNTRNTDHPSRLVSRGVISKLIQVAVVAGLSWVVVACQNELPVVSAEVETEAVHSGGDAADDPAIWINRRNLERSLIFGSDKKRGVEVYNLSGIRIQALEIGGINNVDIRQDVRWGDKTTDLAVGTNRSAIALSLLHIDREDGKVDTIENAPLTMETPYGLCLFKPHGKESLDAFVNDKSGLFEQWELLPDGASAMVASFQIETQPEDCVVDDENGVLYFGEEEKGVFRIDIDSIGSKRSNIVDLVANGRLADDVEGIALYRTDASQGYLVISSQGDNSYALYRPELNNEYVGSFRVADRSDRSIDGTSGTDGIEICSSSLGTRFPSGLMIVQDGRNTNPSENQNFKLLDWRVIESSLNF